MKHPTMENQPFRYALACVAARFLLANVHNTYPSLQPELLPVAIAILTITLIVLMIIAYCTANGFHPVRRKDS